MRNEFTMICFPDSFFSPPFRDPTRRIQGSHAASAVWRTASLRFLPSQNRRSAEGDERLPTLEGKKQITKLNCHVNIFLKAIRRRKCLVDDVFGFGNSLHKVHTFRSYKSVGKHSMNHLRSIVPASMRTVKQFVNAVTHSFLRFASIICSLTGYFHQ